MVEIGFPASSVTVMEGDGFAVLSIELSGQLNEGVTVKVSVFTADVTATGTS